MILIELELVGTDAGSVMVNPNHVTEVVETTDGVRLFLSSGNQYHVSGESFGAALNSLEGFKYLKINREPVEEEPVKEVEGEIVD